MKTMHHGKVLTAALALLLAAALTLAGCQGAATAPPAPVSPPPAEESSGAAPESSSQADEPAEPEPETSAPEPPAESSSQPEETPPQSGASGPAAPAPASGAQPKAASQPPKAQEEPEKEEEEELEPDGTTSGSQTAKGERGAVYNAVYSEKTKALFKKYGVTPLPGYESTDDGQWIEYEDRWDTTYLRRVSGGVMIDGPGGVNVPILEFLGDYQDKANVLSWTEDDIQSAANKTRSRYPTAGDDYLGAMVAYAHWLQNEKYGVQSSSGQAAQAQPQVPTWTPPTQEEIEEQERQAEEWRKQVLEEAKQRAAEQEAERQRKSREEYEREHAEEIAAREEYERAAKAAEEERLKREEEERRRYEEEQEELYRMQQEYDKEVKEREEAALQQEAEETP